MLLTLHSPLWSRRIGWVLACAVALGLAAPAAAQRPSLIELQAALAELVSPAQASVSGGIHFGTGAGALDFELVELEFAMSRTYSCTQGCETIPLSFERARATVVQTADIAALSARLLAETPQDVTANDLVNFRDPFVSFTGAVVRSIDSSSAPGRSVIEFDFVTLFQDALPPGLGWDTMNNILIGDPCLIPIATTVHVDLAGNPSTSLFHGEVATSSVKLDVSSGGQGQAARTVISFVRQPPNACYFFATLQGERLDVSFERLWPQDDDFAGRQSVETLTATDVNLGRAHYRFIEGALTESIEVEFAQPSAAGTQTLREFDPATGAETDSQSFDF